MTDIHPLPFESVNSEATTYVGTLAGEGLAQLEILKELGCEPHHSVLEIGCGALVGGYPIMQYLDRGNYFGIDPNVHLREQSLLIEEVNRTVREKSARFSDSSNFQSGADQKFDFIIAHSILSHASNAQLTQFMEAVKSQLAPGGRIAASVRFAEGNKHGSPGNPESDAAFKEWTYPGVSWFKENTVIERAAEAGLYAGVASELTDLILKGNSEAVHDWFYARHTEVKFVTAFFDHEGKVTDESAFLAFVHFSKLAKSRLPIVLFLDERYADRYSTMCNGNDNVRVVLMSVTELREMWPFAWSAQNPSLKLPATRNEEKDTRDFLLIQNCKLDFLNMALGYTPPEEEVTHLAWIDFDIMSLSKNHKEFHQRLQDLRPHPVRGMSPGCHATSNASVDAVDWRFCGGFLLLDHEAVAKAYRLSHTAMQVMDTVTWEVNVWSAIERGGFDFGWYRANHDDSILPPTAKDRRLIQVIEANEEQKTRSKHRICLVMIVKNEAHIIERCLAHALPFIDSWCITDTGSTDGTQDLIKKFFVDNPVSGALMPGTFENYSQARNDALINARRMYDELDEPWEYALLIDADMILAGDLDTESLTAPAYKIIQKSGYNLEYFNTRMVRFDVPSRYVGVTHEHIDVEGVQELRGFWIDDQNDGGNKPEKSERDIRLLTQGLIDEPNNGRYMFYLAQTYRDTGRHEEAIELYKKRISVGGWEEELWFSMYGIALSYQALGKKSEFAVACIEAYNFRPTRGETLKQLSKFFRDEGKNDAAFLISTILSGLPKTTDELFVEPDVYEFGAAEEFAIAGFYSKNEAIRGLGYRSCANLTTHSRQHVRENALKSFTYYMKSVSELFDARVVEIPWKPNDGWAPMNPSVSVVQQRLILIRTVNYKVTDGNYPTIDNSGIIRTKNYIAMMNAHWDKILEFHELVDATNTQKSDYPVEGFEDCRIWPGEKSFFASGTVRNLSDNADGRCEMSVLSLNEKYQFDKVHVIRDYEHHLTQKNWMPVFGKPGHFLYLCDPTVLIFVDGMNPTKEIVRHQPRETLTGLRGGTQVIPHGTGWVCLTHEVSWRPERVYLHRFVYLNEAFEVEAISDPFYFMHVGIEFCAGLARDGNLLIASFGVNDASAHLAIFDPEAVNRSLRRI